jgi:hypothetical protein
MSGELQLQAIIFSEIEERLEGGWKAMANLETKAGVRRKKECDEKNGCRLAAE